MVPLYPMRLHRFAFLSAALALVSTIAPAAPASQSANPTSGDWPAVTSQSKPWARWWWLGSAVDQPNLTRELEAIAANGFGGVEITPIYGAKGYESRFIPFLSPKYVEMLSFVTAEAHRLGLGVDMATGTGWPFGGPQVTKEDAEQRIRFVDGRLQIRPTNFHVKRAAPGGEGLVLDPYSVTAMQHYLAPFTQALSVLPAGALRGQFHDSFEYTGNWSPELPARFKAMHGYDLLEHVGELSGQGDPDTVARVKSDYRTTLGALHLDYLNTWVKWSHDHGYLARDQAHGSPGNLLDLYAAADIPETEIFGSHEFPIPGYRREAMDVNNPAHPPVIHRFASSAAHVAGHPLASSETFTWMREHFRGAPSQMKPEIDTLFLTGINAIFYHGDAYSPADAPWPGWLFYASTQANTRNPLWPEFSSVNAYIARAQSLLQSGAPDADVLVYWPVDDLWHNPDGLQLQLTVHASWLEGTSLNAVAQELVSHGFEFDFISDAQLAQTRYVAGELQTAGGTHYRTIVVPRTAHMPVATLQNLLRLANDGATVIFVDQLPSDVPGYGDLQNRRDQLKAEIAKVALKSIGHSGAGETLRAEVGQGQVLVCSHIEDASLRSALVSGILRKGPDPILVDFAAYHGLGVTRRRTADGHIYFFSNLTAKPFEDWTLIDDAQSAELMDALTGTTGAAALHANGGHGPAAVYLQLQPGESIFVRTHQTSTPVATTWTYAHASGLPLAVNGPWHVSFIAGGPELPAARDMTYLHSWANDPDEAAQRFGGTARYETEFTLPAETKADDWQLDLGDVRETARVFLNGTEVTRLWSFPMRTHLGAALKPGKNTLAIEVTSTAANRIRDLDRRHVPWKNFHEINFVNVHYQPFDASDWPLTPCGLLGPVTITPLKRFTP